MPLASSNRAAVRYIEEVTWGTTPATPTLLDFRYTGESLNYNLSNIQSEEIRADRMVSDLVQVQSDASGDINFEWSYATLDDFIAGAMLSTWSADLAIVGAAGDISAVNASNQFTSTTGSKFASVAVGQWIYVSGFSTSANNGWFLVTAIPDTETLTVVGAAALADETPAGTDANINGKTIKNGTAEKSYTIQKHFQDITAPAFYNFTGAKVNTLSMSLAPGAIATGTLGFMARDGDMTTTQYAGASVTAANTNDVLNAVGNVAGVYENDTLSTLNFSSFSFTLNNNYRAQDAIANLPHVGIAPGQLEVTGDIEAYFEDTALYNKFLAGTATSLNVVMSDAASNGLVVSFPNVQFESGELVAGSLDTDVIARMTWRAILDSTTSSMIQFDTHGA